MTTELGPLRRLARLYGVQTGYRDVFGRRRSAAPEAILAVLRALGAPVDRLDQVPDALRERRRSLWRRGIDPVAVAWDGAPLSLSVRLPATTADAVLRYSIVLENGDRLEGEARSDAAPALVREVDGITCVRRRVVVADRLPLGYHRLELSAAGRSMACRIICAPFRAFGPSEAERVWGLFAPTYALAGARSLGLGDLGDLEELLTLTAELGGSVVATLPLLAAFLDEPFNPSPYAPVSRLFWNEIYLDLRRVPELERCPVARAILNSSGLQAEVASLRAADLVDYRRAMAVKRRVLEELARCGWRESTERMSSFRGFLERRPLAEDYAEFRAKTERARTVWSLWPAAQRDGRLTRRDYDESVKQYHLYVQWQADEQMRWLAERAKSEGVALYLDFPAGTNRDGYDVWRERAIFALEASGGAPPDEFFTAGQDWGFPPLRPEASRAQGHSYYIRALRHHLECAGILRIDHVMGLHRSFWVPAGFAAAEGVYVRYPAEELYAILSLESHRHRARIVGENLGTVPPYVNVSMARHNIAGLHVGQFCVGAEPGAVEEPRDGAVVASLNTHDTPTFASFWSGADIEDRLALGLLDPEQARAEAERRARQRESLVRFLRSHGIAVDGGDARGVLRAWLERLAGSPAFLVLVNLEDLWLEPRPQNVPGTWEERPNWRRKARVTMGELRGRSDLLEILRAVGAARARPEVWQR
ncbi:MAG TPA: 4-alpha-glucanotransferase [candidate division Zixibacteria bacterium]|nr:4-alpha-glucanotransferase [candidate division Zixibacteria bacterium]